MIEKLLSQEIEDQRKRLFIKEEEIIHGINRDYIVKSKAACMEQCAIRFFDFASLWRLNHCQQSGQTSTTSSHEWGNRPISTSKKDRPGNNSWACTLAEP